MDDLYEYQPLDAVLGEIRLLRIDEAEAGKRIQCTMQHFLMELTPQYIALSYTWDNPLGKADYTEEFGEDININKRPSHRGNSLPVRYNLACALRTLSRGPSQWYWIDAICLNQSNNIERNEQVPRMGAIYSGAFKVIIWLGPSSVDSDHAIAFIHHISMNAITHGGHETAKWLQNTLTGEQCYNYWKAYMSLIARSWWRRAWVVQEVALAADLELWCGAIQLGWEPLVNMMVVSQLIDFGDLLGKHCNTSELGLQIMTCNAICVQMQARRDFRERSGTNLQLLHILNGCREFLATDNRDKLFSVLSLVSQRERDLIDTNYGTSVRNIYTSFAKTYIEATGDLQIVTLARENLPASFPSWVPDWTQTALYTSFSIRLSTGQDSMMEFCAHKSTRSRCDFSNSMEAMTCRGIYFGDVDGMGAHTGTAVDSYVRIGVQTSTTNNAYPTAKDTFEAVWRSCCQNVEGFYSPPPIRHRLAGDLGAYFVIVWLQTWLEMNPVARMNAILATEPSPGSMNMYSEFSFLRLGGRTIHEIVLEEFHHYQALKKLAISADVWARLLPPIRATRKGRRFLITREGYVGWAPRSTEKGDKIFVLFGCGTPVILRPCGDAYRLVGECYIHGIMSGEVIDDLEKDKYQVQDVTIV